MPEYGAARLSELSESEVPGKSHLAQAWGLTGVIWLFLCLNFGDKVLLGLAAQPLQEEFDLSATDIGLASSVFYLATTIGMFATGLLTRSVTVKLAMAGLATVWLFSTLPMVILGGLATLLITRFILGLVEGPAYTLGVAASFSWFPADKRSLPGAFIAASTSISKIALAPLLAIAVAAFGWRAGFIGLSLACLLWCVLWLVVWKDGPYGATTRTDPVSGRSTPRIKWSTIFLSWTFLSASAALFGYQAMVAVVLTWLPSFFEIGLGYSQLQAGAMFGLPSAVALIAMFTGSFLADRLMGKGVSSRIVRGGTSGVSLIICGVVLVLLPSFTAPIVAVAAISIGYGIGSLAFPLLVSAISEICPPAQLAGTMGAFMALSGIGGIVGPYLTGKIVDGSSSPLAGYNLSFQIFGLCALVGGVLALFFVNPSRDAHRIG